MPFVSPIDGTVQPDTWTAPRTVLVKVENWGSGETGGSNIPWNGWTGPLTNAPGDALTYKYGPGQNPGQYRAGDETNRGNDWAEYVEMAAPDFERWNSAFWAYKHPQAYAASQAESNGGGGLFDMAYGLATSNIMVPIYAAAGAYLAGAGTIGAEALTGEAAAANTGYIDALGGMTDATGTALQGWSEISTSTAIEGATNVDTISDWFSSYSSDPGADPFATTEQVNAGWSYDGGYPGVDWYNNAGVGEASSATSLNDIFSNVSKAIKSATSILTSAQQLAGQNRVQPNMTRTHAAGQMNLALPLLLGAAFFAFR